MAGKKAVGGDKNGGGGKEEGGGRGGSSFSSETEFGLVEFEDYYDDLFGEAEHNNINYNQFKNTIRYIPFKNCAT